MKPFSADRYVYEEMEPFAKVGTGTATALPVPAFADGLRGR